MAGGAKGILAGMMLGLAGVSLTGVLLLQGGLRFVGCTERQIVGVELAVTGLGCLGWMDQIREDRVYCSFVHFVFRGKLASLLDGVNRWLTEGLIGIGVSGLVMGFVAQVVAWGWKKFSVKNA